MIRHTTHQALLVVIGAIAFLAALSALRPAPPLILFAVDGSGSTNTVRPRYLAVMDALVTAAPSGSRWVVYRFDAQVGTAFQGYPARPRDLWASQDRELKPDIPEQGTRPDLMLEHLIQQVLPACTEKRVGLVLSWDGANDGQPLAPYAAALARDTRVVLWIVGPEGRRRTEAEKEFRALDVQGRLVTSGLGDAAPGQRRFLAKLAAR